MNSPKITLRALEPEDLELLYTIENDTEAWDTSSARVNYSKFAIKQYIAQQPQELAACGEMRLVITDSTTHKAVGTADLTGYSPTDRSAEIGIAVLKSERGKGYGKAAIEALEHYARNFYNMRMLYAHTSDKNNPAAKNLFAGSGYTQVATLPEWHFYSGEYEDLAVFKKKL